MHQTPPAPTSSDTNLEEDHSGLALEVLPQPDDTTCGPTCLHAVYRYWGHELTLERVISEIKELPEGGTLAVTLACHALLQGFNASIISYNLQIFDPTWFRPGVDISARLREQLQHKHDAKLALATAAYLQFLDLGGSLHHEDLTAKLLSRYLHRGIPVLTGLNATYLYQCPRELDNRADDLRGSPVGHFVILSAYRKELREVNVADPLHDNPLYGTQYYHVGIDRLVCSILLGILTYDANLLVITPKEPR